MRPIAFLFCGGLVGAIAGVLLVSTHPELGFAAGAVIGFSSVCIGVLCGIAVGVLLDMRQP